MNIPPFPSFIVTTLFAVVILLKVLQRNPPPIIPFPTQLCATLFLALVIFCSIANLTGNGNIVQRLFGLQPRGRQQAIDIFNLLRYHPQLFWYATGETPESFELIVNRIAGDITSPRHTPRIPRTNRRRACKLDVFNRCLLVLIWLRQYEKLYILSLMFGISKSTVAEEIYHIVPILFVRYRSFITWHSLRKWSTFLNTVEHFPNAVGMIDATPHEIRRPSGARQAQFYRGDKRYHFMSTQMVIDADGLIVLLVAG